MTSCCLPIEPRKSYPKPLPIYIESTFSTEAVELILFSNFKLLFNFQLHLYERFILEYNGRTFIRKHMKRKM